MAAPAEIALEDAERGIMLAILNAALPPGVTVGVFGSRAAGEPRRYSDLDLAIDAGRSLTLDETVALADAFEQSHLPWRVDLIDLHAVSADFRRLIERDRRVLAVSGPERHLHGIPAEGSRTERAHV